MIHLIVSYGPESIIQEQQLPLNNNGEKTFSSYLFLRGDFKLRYFVNTGIHCPWVCLPIWQSLQSAFLFPSPQLRVLHTLSCSFQRLSLSYFSKGSVSFKKLNSLRVSVELEAAFQHQPAISSPIARSSLLSSLPKYFTSTLLFFLHDDFKSWLCLHM